MATPMTATTNCTSNSSQPRSHQGGDDADQDGQPDRDVLSSGEDQPGEGADDGTNDDRRNDTCDGHDPSISQLLVVREESGQVGWDLSGQLALHRSRSDVGRTA